MIFIYLWYNYVSHKGTISLQWRLYMVGDVSSWNGLNLLEVSQHKLFSVYLDTILVCNGTTSKYHCLNKHYWHHLQIPLSTTGTTSKYHCLPLAPPPHTTVYHWHHLQIPLSTNGTTSKYHCLINTDYTVEPLYSKQLGTKEQCPD